MSVVQIPIFGVISNSKRLELNGLSDKEGTFASERCYLNEDIKSLIHLLVFSVVFFANARYDIVIFRCAAVTQHTKREWADKGLSDTPKSFLCHTKTRGQNWMHKKWAAHAKYGLLYFMIQNWNWTLGGSCGVFSGSRAGRLMESEPVRTRLAFEFTHFFARFFSVHWKTDD